MRAIKEGARAAVSRQQGRRSASLKALRARKAFRTGGDQNCTSALLPAVWARALATDAVTVPLRSRQNS